MADVETVRKRKINTVTRTTSFTFVQLSGIQLRAQF